MVLRTRLNITVFGIALIAFVYMLDRLVKRGQVECVAKAMRDAFGSHKYYHTCIT